MSEAARPPALRAHPDDNVAVVARTVPEGTTVAAGVITCCALRLGQKVAIKPIPRGAEVLRYGAAIGVALHDIRPGELVHVHNLASQYMQALTYPERG